MGMEVIFHLSKVTEIEDEIILCVAMDNENKMILLALQHESSVLRNIYLMCFDSKCFDRELTCRKKVGRGLTLFVSKKLNGKYGKF